MDKIYSRNRIRLQRINFQGSRGNNKIKKILRVLLILIISILVFSNTLKAIDPIFDSVCKDTSKEIVIIQVNKITSDNMRKYENSDMIKIINDEEGNIKLLQVNSNPLNNMISDITNDIQTALSSNDVVNSYIPFGSITGIKWIAGSGPKIPIKISLSGTIDTKIRNEFNEAGINQTIHRLWLDVSCNISILTPYKVEETLVTNEIILSENVIIGGVPTVYMNMNEK